MSLERLSRILRKMNLPQHRKNRMTSSNLKWLAKNLSVKNSDHPDYQEALDIIKAQVRI